MHPASIRPEQFEALVREHQAMVFRTIARLTGRGAHVEDLAQEVFLRLHRALPYFRGDATMATYLYRITFNVAQDEWKRRRRERLHIAGEPAFVDEDGEDWMENLPSGPFAGAHARTPEQSLLTAEFQQAVETALAGLAEMERAALVLYHQEECSYEGIAAILGVPINTVRTHMHRGRQKLREAMQRHAASSAIRGPVASKDRGLVTAGRER
jgi:RNA polymerase sigma-70 factor (ECF subfamily)